MREATKKLIKDSIRFEYFLPNDDISISKSIISSIKDACFREKSDLSISEVIYNNIIEYAIGEFEIDYANLNIEQLRALNEYMRFDSEDSDQVKKRYGFFGEVLLYSILYAKFKTEVLISKGYFYNPLERAEPKGYDAYHLIQLDKKVQLWFGEAKFRENLKSSIEESISNLSKTLSSKYFEKNIIAINKEKSHITSGGRIINLLYPITESWKRDVSIVIKDELLRNKITLIYPILIIYQQGNFDYNDSIRNCISIIDEYVTDRSLEIPDDLNAKIHFIFLPVENVKNIKEKVITWISEKKPLI